MHQSTTCVVVPDPFLVVFLLVVFQTINAPKATGESSEMKVLRRLVQPRIDGTYLVPNEIVEKFKDIAGGGRAEVLQLFQKHNGDKDI